MKLTRPTAVLLAAFGSGVSLVTVAVSSTSVVSLATNVTLIVSRAPAGKSESLQVMVVPEVGPIGVAGQVADAPELLVDAMLVIVTGAGPAMIRSLMTTLRASD